ncbi:hypothetical protein MHU86_25217 [Fragilaria crotonensis]|nr:hypothetical protein MHU86_25217 [Fragilaria crotonensis]
MERKLQAIPNGVKKGVGFEVVVGLLVVGACVGSAVLIGFSVGDASEIGEKLGCDMSAPVIGSGDGVVVHGAARGVGGTPMLGTMGGDVSEELPMVLVVE